MRQTARLAWPERRAFADALYSCWSVFVRAGRWSFGIHATGSWILCWSHVMQRNRPSKATLYRFVMVMLHKSERPNKSKRYQIIQILNDTQILQGWSYEPWRLLQAAFGWSLAQFLTSPQMRGTFPLWLHWAPPATGSPLRDFKLKFPDPRPFVQKHGLHLRDLWDLGGFGWFWWFSDWFQKVLKVEAFGAPCFYAQCIPMPELRIGPWPCFYAPHGEGRLWILGYNFCTYTLQSNGTCSRPFLAISLLVSRLG